MAKASAVFIQVIAVVAIACAGVAQAADYPVKSIHLVSAYTPGGGNDILARTVGQRLSEVVGQQVIIDNRPGAAGAIVRHDSVMSAYAAARELSNENDRIVIFGSFLTVAAFLSAKSRG